MNYCSSISSPSQPTPNRILRTCGKAHLATLAITVIITSLTAVWAHQTYRLTPFPFPKLQHPPPTRLILADVAEYEDELFAYLMLQYLRSRHEAPRNTFIGYERRRDRILYTIHVFFPNGLKQTIDTLFPLAHAFPFLIPRWRTVTVQRAAELEWQTTNLIAAYNHPSNRKLENLPRQEILAYIARFIRFKSQTDPRVRRRIPDAPSVLTLAEARALSRDILTVADFYSLPLDFFLGIGAMENNYMNVTGDLDHAIWKSKPHRGDTILRRSKGRVLVLNPASGVWQITRETLRWAHRLYTQDTRDYSRLPLHLRPQPKLDFDQLTPQVLTTYAGLFLRHLLDRFDGNVALAVGAYNGGPGNPNQQYEAGVREVAQQARRIMQQAAGLRGVKVANMQFLSSLPAR